MQSYSRAVGRLTTMFKPYTACVRDDQGAGALDPAAELQHFAIAQLPVEKIREVLASKCTDRLGDESVCDENDDLLCI